MNVTGSQQQPKKSTNAGGREALVLNPAALYVIHASHENVPSIASTTFENELEKDGKSPFTEIKHLNATPFREFSETSLHQQLIRIQDHKDLEKLENLAIQQTGNIHLSLNENWAFEIVRKLPWIFHKHGLTPMFFEANKNANWQRNTSALRKLYDKGVVMPIDIMAVVRWQTTERNWWNRVFLSRSKVALEAKAALYLMGIQVHPPYFVHQRDLAQLQQWISEGILL
jgi:hypothetical protein